MISISIGNSFLASFLSITKLSSTMSRFLTSALAVEPMTSMSLSLRAIVLAALLSGVTPLSMISISLETPLLSFKFDSWLRLLLDKSNKSESFECFLFNFDLSFFSVSISLSDFIAVETCAIWFSFLFDFNSTCLLLTKTISFTSSFSAFWWMFNFSLAERFSLFKVLSKDVLFSVVEINWKSFVEFTVLPAVSVVFVGLTSVFALFATSMSDIMDTASLNDVPSAVFTAGFVVVACATWTLLSIFWADVLLISMFSLYLSLILL